MGAMAYLPRVRALQGNPRRFTRSPFSGDFDASRPRAAIPLAPGSAHAVGVEESSTLRVLVVEDDRDTAEMLRALLNSYGYIVAVAETSQQGIEAARRLEPHIVLCDIGLPDSDGYVVASVLKQGGQRTRARLIAVTGRGQPRDRLRALAAGFDEHLVKPVDPRVLLHEMRVTH